VDPLAAFSPDYATARARFRAAAEAKGWVLQALPIAAEGPRGIELTIDVARLGPENPRRVVVVSSGTHGVEGYFGSAVQLALLEGAWADVDLPDDTGLLLVHAVNPYGFAWNRRVNEDNVDLNRNFLLAAEGFEGVDPGYVRLEGLLNPQTPPGGFEAFLPRAVLSIVRYGFASLKAAIAVGQYEFARGLFYGGDGPSASQRALAEALPAWFGACERVVHLDLHTGMGERGTFALAVAEDEDTDRVRWLSERFEQVQALSEDGVLYPIRGVFGAWLQEQLPGVEYLTMLAEFGTVPPLKVLAALRAENRATHWGHAKDPTTAAAKAGMLEAFAPSDPTWRAAVVGSAVAIAEQARATLSEPSH
jgi:hypothetical protein